MRKIYEFRKECDKQIDELNHKIANAAIGHYIEEVKETYKTNERVISYIKIEMLIYMKTMKKIMILQA